MNRITRRQRKLFQKLENYNYYSYLALNVEYGYNGSGVIGEMDIVGVKGDLINYYELKSTNKRKDRDRAIEQLKRAGENILNGWPIKTPGNKYLNGRTFKIYNGIYIGKSRLERIIHKEKHNYWSLEL